MASLKEIHKLFIIQQFALFSTSSEIIDLVKEEFDVIVTKQQLQYYNANLNQYLPQKWRKIYEDTRAKFLENVSDIPIANKAFRLKELDRLYRKQKNSKLENTVEARATLEQAAKESGDAFSNKQKIEHEGTLHHTVVRVPPKLSPEEWLKQSNE